MIGRAVSAGVLLITTGCSLLNSGQPPVIALVTVNGSAREATLVIEQAGREDRLPYQPCSSHVIELEQGQRWRLGFNETTIVDSGTHQPLIAGVTIIRVELHNDEASISDPVSSDRMPDAPLGFDCDA